MRNIDWLSDERVIKVKPKLIFEFCQNEWQKPLIIKLIMLFKNKIKNLYL